MKRPMLALALLLATACGLALPPAPPVTPPDTPPVVQPEAPPELPPVVPPPVDWCSTKTEDQLRSIRADLGGVRLSVPTSATRGSYLFTPTYPSFDAPMRQLIRREYKARGYTHFPIGPVWERGYPGWAGHDFRSRPAEWAALLEELWRDDLIPVVWLLPDGPYNVQDGPGNRNNPPSLTKIRNGLTPIYQHPDIQRTTCVVVLGWEVTDNEWIKTLGRTLPLIAWMRNTFPRAYRGWHAAVDNGAPCNYDEDGEGCEGKAWRAMAPLGLHFQFYQTGTPGGWNLAAGRDPGNQADRVAQFIENVRYEVMRFHTDHYQPGGIRGVDGKLLDVIYGEGSAYFELNDRETEAWGREWGRLAMTIPGVRGFGDGGPGVR